MAGLQSLSSWCACCHGAMVCTGRLLQHGGIRQGIVCFGGCQEASKTSSVGPTRSQQQDGIPPRER